MNETTKDIGRVAALGDLHCPRTPAGQLQVLFSQINDCVDVLLLCGDLTDYGRREEAETLAKVCGSAKIPVLAVLGNHDYECGQEKDVTQILCDAGVEILDGES